MDSDPCVATPYFLMSQQADVFNYNLFLFQTAQYGFLEHQHPVLLIADECHHYSTDENCRIFDFVPYIKNEHAYCALGLSATSDMDRHADKIGTGLGKEIYRYRFSQAHKENIISDFVIFNISVPFNDDERCEYAELSDHLSKAITKLKNLYPSIRKTHKRFFFAKLEQLARQKSDIRLAELARMICFLAYKRKEIVYMTNAKVNCVKNIIQRLPETAKIIIFGERPSQPSGRVPFKNRPRKSKKHFRTI